MITLEEAVEKSAQEQQLNAHEIQVRDKFVKEYLRDHDAFKACIRIGFAPGYAKEYSARFMMETYVLNKLQEQEGQYGESEDLAIEQAKIKKALWREVNFDGVGSSQSARVAALSKLSAFYGMDAPSRNKTELTGADGQPLGDGVFVVPGVITAEEWAKQAELQQEQLVRPTSPPKLKVA